MQDIKLKSTTAQKKPCSQSGKQWPPDVEQLRGVKWLVQRSEAALFLDPGAGKTSIVYAAFKVKRNAGLVTGMLVIAPLRPATSTWPAEQREWIDFHEIDVVVLHGNHKDELVMERHDVYVVNYEGLAWLINSGHLKRLLKNKWVNVLTLDELTKMKNPSKKAARRKLLVPYLPRFDIRWGLTGSPAANGLIHIFGQVNVLDLGRAFGPYITHFRAMFFTPVGLWGWALKEGAEKLIYDRLKPLALRMELGSGVKLPQVRDNDIFVELPPAARRAYDEMEDDMLTILNNDRVSAGSASAVYGKCWQLASGAIFKSKIDPITGAALVGDGEWHSVHDAKMEALIELLEEVQGQQVLIGYWFKHSLERLKKHFGNDVPHIGSGVSVKKALAYEEAWNAGELPVLLGHPMSMAHGLNFQKSSPHHVIWFDVSPDFELYDQFIRRLRRRGNMSKFMYVHHILARQTVEVWNIMPSLRRKNKGQLRLFDALRLRARGLKLTRNK